ncbi:polysaccharide deacetylase family protein [Natrarchaeobius chitinivorans]|uniref:Polysaccharide deacetylase family protein n=1 Tax=Natrarchaeobius chitinivorans TaxID=1679083 RepID=A0A3N6LRU1_NATCH|nr:polysaccharide deacetylase family protein [Natrarchaeobius chitinivorans]RQG92528.1 polysaccharide deacetylase family protein [Natrarchaeobius chitinivorans]
MARAYFTVDDAPSETLPEKVATLERYDVPAVFFCEGRRLAEYPERARHALEAGFHLGNHTYSHEHASGLSVEAFREELERTETLLEEVYDSAAVSRPERLFRFPFGEKGTENREDFQQVLERYDFRPPDADRFGYEWYDDHHGGDYDWHWTLDSKDWAVDGRDELRGKIDSQSDRLAHPSPDIVLIHDGGIEPELFEASIELLLERGVEPADPLDLLDGGSSDD